MKGKKRQRAEKQVEVNTSLAELSAKVQAALGLLDSETADGIIGEPGDEHRTLLEGIQALHGVQWATMQSFGLKKNPGSLKAMSQHQVIVLTMVHYAYALGVQRGREETAA